MGGDGRPVSTLRTTVARGPNATNTNTNASNDGQPVPVDYQSVLARASGARACVQLGDSQISR